MTSDIECAPPMELTITWVGGILCKALTMLANTKISLSTLKLDRYHRRDDVSFDIEYVQLQALVKYSTWVGMGVQFYSGHSSDRQSMIEGDSGGCSGRRVPRPSDPHEWEGMLGDADSPRPTHSEHWWKSCADCWGLAGTKYGALQSHSYESGREIPGSPRYSTQLASCRRRLTVPPLVVAYLASSWVHEEFSWFWKKWQFDLLLSWLLSADEPP